MTELRKKPIFMLSGYFDESGITSSDKVCVIAGFMGGPSAMKRMKKKWNKALDDFGVSVPFHAIQFYAPPDRILASKSNPYRGWSNTKRKRFFNALLDAMKDRELRLKAVGVDAVAFRACSKQERRWLTGGRYKIMNPEKWLLSGSPDTPYHYVLRAIIESCAQSLQDASKVHIFMSRQKQYEGFALQLFQAILDRQPPFDFRDHLDGSMTFASPEDHPQLQAADLVSYHMYQAALERRTNPIEEADGVFKQLVDLAWESKDLQLSTAETLRQHCQQFSQKQEGTARIASLRSSRLRVKVSHDPEDCQILGKVDESGIFHPEVQDT
ncbi:MAG TPA: DUF3800 domain-containing protein [Acidobacteriaceae bacterium]|jgi:hypothetical protein